MQDTNTHEDDLGHAIPDGLLYRIFGALVVLTVVTVLVAQVDFGTANIVIAMLIASAKALLVALFFMHLKYEHPATWLYALLPVLLMFVLIGGVFIDNPYRMPVLP